MNTPITLTFTYTDDDWLHGHNARQAFLNGPLSLEILGCVVVVGLFFGHSFLCQGNLRVESLMGTCFLCGIAILHLGDRLLGSQRMVDQFRTNAQRKASQRLTFADAFIENETEKLKLSWSWFQLAFESSESFLLFLDTKQMSCVIIPKRVFANAEQQQQFKQLVSEKLTLKSHCRKAEQHSSSSVLSRKLSAAMRIRWCYVPLKFRASQTTGSKSSL